MGRPASPRSLKAPLLNSWAFRSFPLASGRQAPECSSRWTLARSPGITTRRPTLSPGVTQVWCVLCACERVVCARVPRLQPPSKFRVPSAFSREEESTRSASLLEPGGTGTAAAGFRSLAGIAFPRAALRKCSSYQLGHRPFRSGEGAKRFSVPYPSLRLTLPSTPPRLPPAVPVERRKGTLAGRATPSGSTSPTVQSK